MISTAARRDREPRRWSPTACGRSELATAGVVHQIGMPWHFGWQGYATGDIANVLTAIVGDPNTSMHESKALTCNLRKGRLQSTSEGVARS